MVVINNRDLSFFDMALHLANGLQIFKRHSKNVSSTFFTFSGVFK